MAASDDCLRSVLSARSRLETPHTVLQRHVRTEGDSWAGTAELEAAVRHRRDVVLAPVDAGLQHVEADVARNVRMPGEHARGLAAAAADVEDGGALGQIIGPLFVRRVEGSDTPFTRPLLLATVLLVASGLLLIRRTRRSG